uniref:2-succinyl-6-hydroxy-2, 4-cyclohexadiene-1-carboxylate synthase n=1 Tax=Ascaris lumbricoides TaxID=6252 RepID=A0A0M3IB29_ASCLU
MDAGYRTGARISTVDIWRNETDNGNVIIAHGINSWPALLEQLNEPILERSAVIEGDVLLYKQRKHRNRAIPLMSAPSKIADRITFKEWLREVSKLRKDTGHLRYLFTSPQQQADLVNTLHDKCAV